MTSRKKKDNKEYVYIFREMIICISCIVSIIMYKLVLTVYWMRCSKCCASANVFEPRGSRCDGGIWKINENSEIPTKEPRLKALDLLAVLTSAGVLVI